jgi:hypothetical protein
VLQNMVSFIYAPDSRLRAKQMAPQAPAAFRPLPTRTVSIASLQHWDDAVRHADKFDLNAAGIQSPGDLLPFAASVDSAKTPALTPAWPLAAFSARAARVWRPSGKPLYGASWRLIRPSWKALRRPCRLFMSDAAARVAAPRQKQAADVPRNASKIASFADCDPQSRR